MTFARLLYRDGAASADATNNGNTEDAQGYSIANNLHNG